MDTVAVPSAAPLHDTSVVVVAAFPPGVVPTTASAVAVHALASVMVTEYDPAASAVAVAVACEGVVFQEYVNAPVPPEAATVAEPFWEVQFSLTVVVEATMAVGSVMTAVAVAVQALASVTLTEYVPAVRAVALAVA